MENLTFIAYAVEKNILDGCIILADYVWQPENADTPFYDFSINLFKEIFKDYKKTCDGTENWLDAVQEIVYVSRTIKRHAEELGEKEHEERQADSFVYEC